MQNTLLDLMDNTDHAAAITGAAYLDHALEVLLKSDFRPLNSRQNSRMFDVAANGILATLSSKILMVHALRLVPEYIYNDLVIINAVRNIFAHTLHDLGFTHSDIARECFKLKSPAAGLPSADLGFNPKQHYSVSVFIAYSIIRNVAEERLLSKQKTAASPDKRQ